MATPLVTWVKLGQSGSVSFTKQTDPSPVDTKAGFRYDYDLNNDGKFDIINSTSPTATVPSADLSKPGPHVIRGRILDKDGGFTDYTTTITVNAAVALPTISLSATPQTIVPGQSITLKLTAADTTPSNPNPSPSTSISSPAPPALIPSSSPRQWHNLFFANQGTNGKGDKITDLAKGETVVKVTS